MTIIGPPASGKGVIGGLMKKKGIEVVGMGDLLRQKIKEGDKLIEYNVENGLYVPNKLVFPLILSILNKKNVSKVLCLDGFPRTRTQAEKLVETAHEKGIQISTVHIDTDCDVCQMRALNRKREDDNCSTLKARIEEHEKNFEALSAYLRRHSSLYFTISNNNNGIEKFIWGARVVVEKLSTTP